MFSQFVKFTIVLMFCIVSEDIKFRIDIYLNVSLEVDDNEYIEVALIKFVIESFF